MPKTPQVQGDGAVNLDESGTEWKREMTEERRESWTSSSTPVEQVRPP